MKTNQPRDHPKKSIDPQDKAVIIILGFIILAVVVVAIWFEGFDPPRIILEH